MKKAKKKSTPKKTISNSAFSGNNYLPVRIDSVKIFVIRENSNILSKFSIYNALDKMVFSFFFHSPDVPW